MILFQDNLGERSFYVQTTPSLALSTGDVTECALDTFESALDPISTIADATINSVDALSARKPDEVEPSFGINITGGISFLVAKADDEATINVKLTWRDLNKFNP